jgi:hypothetical protein
MISSENHKTAFGIMHPRGHFKVRAMVRMIWSENRKPAFPDHAKTRAESARTFS